VMSAKMSEHNFNSFLCARWGLRCVQVADKSRLRDSAMTKK